MVFSETHILIDWEKKFSSMKDKIKYPLEITSTENMDVMKDSKHTMSIFYNQIVDDFRGKSKFVIYIIKDNQPLYQERQTSKGRRKVNVNMFDLKISLRKITGGYKIHATDNIQETKVNLKALNLFEKYYIQKEFDSLQHVFHELNKVSDLKWVVTHNFEKLPHIRTSDKRDDIDFLTDNYFLFMSSLDASENPKGTPSNGYSNGGTSVRNYIHVKNSRIPIDIRCIGDNFYCSKLQSDILDNKILYNQIVWIPNEVYHTYSFLYHKIIHKNLETINNQKLDVFMKNNDYKYVKPEISVGFHNVKLVDYEYVLK